MPEAKHEIREYRLQPLIPEADVAGFKAMMAGQGDVVTGWDNKLQSAIALVTPSEMLAEQHRRKAEPGGAIAIIGLPRASRCFDTEPHGSTRGRVRVDAPCRSGQRTDVRVRSGNNGDLAFQHLREWTDRLKDRTYFERRCTGVPFMRPKCYIRGARVEEAAAVGSLF